MRTSISNLNGEQQNMLHHVNKALKRALKPLSIICYGHRARVNFQGSVFLNSGNAKTSTSVFDIFLMISDEEKLPDTTVLEIAKRCFPEDIAGNIIVCRLQEVLLGLQNKNMFFSAVFKKGIVLRGNRNVTHNLPGSFSATCSTAYHKKQQLSSLLQQAQQHLLRAERQLKNGTGDMRSAIASLHESVVFSLRYFIAAWWGTDLQGDFRELLKYTTNINDQFSRVFPGNTTEEAVLLDVINLSLLNEGFCVGEYIVQTLMRRASKILALSQRCVQRKIANVLPA